MFSKSDTLAREKEEVTVDFKLDGNIFNNSYECESNRWWVPPGEEVQMVDIEN